LSQPVDDRSTLEDLLHDTELSAATLTSTLSALVAAPSVNPGMSEHAMLDVVSGYLTGIGCTLTTVEFAPGRPSLAALDLDQRTQLDEILRTLLLAHGDGGHAHVGRAFRRERRKRAAAAEALTAAKAGEPPKGSTG
jgi:hypothetical protein